MQMCGMDIAATAFLGTLVYTMSVGPSKQGILFAKALTSENANRL